MFLTNSVQVTMCVPDDGGHAVDRLLRPQNRAPRLEWSGGGVEYHPSHGEWIRILRASGFAVEALHELYAADGAKPLPTTTSRPPSGPAGGRWRTCGTARLTGCDRRLEPAHGPGRCHCLAIAIRRRSSGSMKWSWSSSPRSICTQLILPVNRLVAAV